jgi:hypothetical protein
MLTTSDTYALVASEKRLYDSCTVYCTPMLLESGDTRVLLNLVNASDNSVGEAVYVYTTAELTAFTATGANDVAKYKSIVEQAVQDSLETLNPGATFTIV